MLKVGIDHPRLLLYTKIFTASNFGGCCNPHTLQQGLENCKINQNLGSACLTVNCYCQVAQLSTH